MNYQLIAFVGWIVAALMGGLWWGERGRCRAAERWAITGTPDGKPKAVSMVPALEAEDRVHASNQEYSEETIERGVEEVMEAAKRQGMPMDEATARREVTALLVGEDVNVSP
ncbi:hypothetical protein LCGC14_2676010 [marine sediment metagenome]|uniref:Uncharacterized protein n=1 Tax=marine sediment metagenome TaxID=412755 RepID=A0A0F9CEH9_9ZZZZ